MTRMPGCSTTNWGVGILDVGCYCISMVRLVAGVATGKDFAEPVEVSGSAHLGETGVDEWAIGSLRFPGDILAQVTTAVQVSPDNVLRIFGSEGTVIIPTPWAPSRDGGASRLTIHRRGENEPQEILIDTAKGLFTIEADTVAEYLDRRQAVSPAMTWEDTLGNMRTLDRWREAIGLEYGIEKPQAMLLPVRITSPP
jgi:predicted dehydrogenase